MVVWDRTRRARSILKSRRPDGVHEHAHGASHCHRRHAIIPRMSSAAVTGVNSTFDRHFRWRGTNVSRLEGFSDTSLASGNRLALVVDSPLPWHRTRTARGHEQGPDHADDQRHRDGVRHRCEVLQKPTNDQSEDHDRDPARRCEGSKHDGTIDHASASAQRAGLRFRRWLVGELAVAFKAATSIGSRRLASVGSVRKIPAPPPPRAPQPSAVQAHVPTP